MELSQTNFDVDLDLYDQLIPWLNRVPSALYLSCIPSWMRGQVEQSSFNDASHTRKDEVVCDIHPSSTALESHTLKEEFEYETTNKRTYDFKFNRNNNIIPIQDIQPPPTAIERQQGYCQRPFCQTGQNRYICTICGKHFSYIGHFRIHKKIHTGIGLHCCRFCQKIFACKRNWKVWVFLT